MSSDSSGYIETTYSEDESIARYIRAKRQERERTLQEADAKRQRLFEEYSGANLEIFRLPGVNFLTFRHTKIKFSFVPSTISQYVSNKVIFYVSLRYRFTNWRVKRDTIPANYKRNIYDLFYDHIGFVVDDENIFHTIRMIYKILVKWTREHEAFRLKKIQMYRDKQDVELDSDDEELFLNEEEIRERLERRNRILKRMIPPTKRLQRRRKRNPQQ